MYTFLRPLRQTRRVLCHRQAKATPDHHEDVHTQAKSHTGLSRRRPHSGEEPHFSSPAEADTGHGPHRSGDDQKKKKKTSWLCWFLFRAVAVVSRLVFCVAPVLSAVLWRPRSRLLLRPGFLWIYPFLSWRQPKNWPSQFFSGIPSQSALRRWYAVWTWSIYLLGPSRSHVVLKIYSRGAAPHSGGALCFRACGDIRLHGRTSGTFRRRSRYGRFGGGTLLQVTQSCVARRNLSFIIERETTLLRLYVAGPSRARKSCFGHANPVQNLSLQTATDPQAVKTAADTMLVPTWTPLCVLSLQPPT